MRAIKFRGQCVETGKWCIGSLNLFEDSATILMTRVIGHTLGQDENIQVEMDVIPKTVGQFTGLQDKNGQDIYFGQDVNICFSSSSGEYIHDCIYTASRDSLGGLEFSFKGMMWESHSYNQFPISSTLCSKYDSLGTIYDGDREYLVVPDSYDRDTSEDRRFPFNEEKVMSFNSRYIELLENNND